MKIILMRHGRPEIDLDALRFRWVTANEFGQVIRAYETGDLAEDSTPPNLAVNSANAVNAHFCSDLERAKTSCKRLGLDQNVSIDPMFSEAGMPFTEGRILRLPILMWSILFRLGWLFGFHANAMPFREIKLRAAQAVDLLIEAAEQHQDILLVGHGIFNRLIGSELDKRHWTLIAANGEGYWSQTVYELGNPPSI
ncbi:histidine phosphatase family protein [Maritalea sp.]|uniref:histidine phosphatase family protein n=1 Tax=Maritalea sp. TaxID=2003361 RepID=UPI003EF5C7B1